MTPPEVVGTIDADYELQKGHPDTILLGYQVAAAGENGVDYQWISTGSLLRMYVERGRKTVVVVTVDMKMLMVRMAELADPYLGKEEKGDAIHDDHPRTDGD